MPNKSSVLRYCHAWRDSSGDPNAKGSYKFPHHRTEGGPANLAACRNGLARLDGSGIPDADKAGVRSHLEAHIADGKPADAIDHPIRTDAIGAPVNRIHALKGPTTAGTPTGWYAIRNADGSQGPAQVYIYDEIGFWGTNAKRFVDDLNSIRANAIDLHVNSPGGDVFDAVAIHAALRNHPATVTAHIDALAASAASFIVQAADQIVMGRSATMMIHDAAGFAIGNAEDMRKLADLLDKMSNTIAGIYADKAGGPLADWRGQMQAETWYNADEAVTAGLADIVASVEPAAADGVPQNSWDLSMFRYPGRAGAPAPVAVAGSGARSAGATPTRTDESRAFVPRVEDLAARFPDWPAATPPVITEQQAVSTWDEMAAALLTPSAVPTVEDLLANFGKEVTG